MLRPPTINCVKLERNWDVEEIRRGGGVGGLSWGIIDQSSELKWKSKQRGKKRKVRGGGWVKKEGTTRALMEYKPETAVGKKIMGKYRTKGTVPR